MKHKLVVIAVAIMAVASIAVAADQARPWYDMKNCEFCKPWSTPEMVKSCSWDQHPISNGVVTLGLFPENMREAYKKASAQMDALGKRAAAGEKIQMCLSCETMGSFFMRGAKMEEIPTKSGALMLLTSSDSTLVAAMHTWAKRNADEQKKMTAAEKK